MTVIRLPEHDVVGIRAANPGPYTLSGTNSWIVGRSPAWIVDPGPALPEHIAALCAEVEQRGGLGGIALTHDHADHSDALPELRRRHPDAPVAAARPPRDLPTDGAQPLGPLRAMPFPGHAPDHVVYTSGRVAFTGDALLGEGSVFIAPDPGALRGYLTALGDLRALALDVLLPGHGPPVRDVRERIDGYVLHRLEREQRLLQALERGRRSVSELLEEVWPDAPAALHLATLLTLAAHLDKLEEEGRLPEDVERPDLPYP